MKQRSVKRKVCMVIGATAVALGAGTAYAYLSGFGTGTATAQVATDGPRVSGTVASDTLAPDQPGYVTVSITNPLDRAIEITLIPKGSSETITDCPAGSVVAGSLTDGVIGDVGTGGTSITQADDSTITIEPNGVGAYRLDALFDTASFPAGDPANLQDGCLAQVLTLDFGPVGYRFP